MPAEATALPKTAKSEQTRQRIKDATARILSRRGYGGTRLIDIANEAGVQMPNIYYYFSGRDELVEEVMVEGVRGIFRQVTAALATSPEASAIERVRIAIDAHLRSVLGFSDYITASTRNAGQVPRHIREGQLAEEQRYARVWRGLIADLRAEGHLAPDIDDYTARMLILGALNWTPEWWRARRGNLERLIASSQDLLLGGLLK